jgi:hypothetical protein
LRAAFGLFFQGLENDFVQARIDGGFFTGRGEAAEGKFAGEHFVEDDAEGIDVGAVIDGVWLFDLFGRHVMRGAETGAAAGERIFGDGFGHEFGDAEVGDFHAAARVEKDVVGLDVAMEDAFVVGILEGFADARDDGEGLVGVDGAGAHGLAEVHAIDIFHQQIKKRAGLAEVVNGDDVWMIEFGEGAAFAGEAFGKVSLFSERLGENFEGDQAIEFWLAGFVNETHPALADEFNDLEMREGARRVRRDRADSGASGGWPRRFQLGRMLVGGGIWGRGLAGLRAGSTRRIWDTISAMLRISMVRSYPFLRENGARVTKFRRDGKRGRRRWRGGISELLADGAGGVWRFVILSFVSDLCCGGYEVASLNYVGFMWGLCGK